MRSRVRGTSLSHHSLASDRCAMKGITTTHMRRVVEKRAHNRILTEVDVREQVTTHHNANPLPGRGKT